MLPFVVPMTRPNCKVPSLEHYIMKISKNEQDNILTRAKNVYVRLCSKLMRLLSKYTWTPLNLWSSRCIELDLLAIVIKTDFPSTPRRI